MSSLSSDPDGGGYSMTVRIYNDDLAIDLARLYSVEQISVEDHYIRYTGPDEFLERYVNDHLRIKLNGKDVKAQFGDKEVQELETIINMYIPFRRKVRSVEIENKILIGLFPDQINLLIYKDDKIEKGVRFTSTYFNETLTND